MKWATNLLFRNRRFSLFVLGLLSALLFVALPLNQRTLISKIVQSVFYIPYWSVADKLDQLLSVYDLNVALQAELVRLKLERVRFEEEKLETEQFRSMLEFLPLPEYEIVPAHVQAQIVARREAERQKE